MDAKYEYDRLVRAVTCIETSRPIIELLRDAQGRDEHVHGVSLADVAHTIEETRRRGGGSALKRAREPHGRARPICPRNRGDRRPADTPDASHVAREQLRGLPSGEALQHHLDLLDACIECHDAVVDVLQISAVCDTMRRVGPVENPLYWQMYTYTTLASICECGGEDLRFLDVQQTNAPALLYNHCVDVDAWLHYLRSNGYVADSPDTTMRILLRRTVYGGLPEELQDVIVRRATSTRTNALHRAVDHLRRARGSSSAAFFRQHLPTCVAMIAASHTVFTTGFAHLSAARDILAARHACICKLERCVTRAACVRAKRRRLDPADDNSGPSGPRRPLPMLNTLVVCDTSLFRHLRAHPAFRARDLTIRHVHGIADLSTALHADVVCINLLSLHVLRNLSFVRCVFCNPRCNYMYSYSVQAVYSGSSRPCITSTRRPFPCRRTRRARSWAWSPRRCTSSATTSSCCERALRRRFLSTTRPRGARGHGAAPTARALRAVTHRAARGPGRRDGGAPVVDPARRRALERPRAPHGAAAQGGRGVHPDGQVPCARAARLVFVDGLLVLARASFRRIVDGRRRRPVALRPCASHHVRARRSGGVRRLRRRVRAHLP